LVKKHDQRLLGHTLDVWMQAERSRLLVSVRENRLVRQAFKHWQEKRQAHLNLAGESMVQRDLVICLIAGITARANDLFQQTEVKFLHNHLSRWRAQFGKHQTSTLRAQLNHERNLQASTFTQWVQATRKSRKDMEDAAKARAFFLLRGVFAVWRGQLGEIKRRRWEQTRRMAEIRGVWEGMSILCRSVPVDTQQYGAGVRFRVGRMACSSRKCKQLRKRFVYPILRMMGQKRLITVAITW
jgi:protein SFI1